MQNLGNINGINAPKSVESIKDLSAAAPVKTKAAAAGDRAEANKGWILNPVLDYLFVCGGLMWLLYGVTFLGLSSTGADPGSVFYSSILYLSAFLITDAHGPATLVRVFESKTTPKKVRYIVAAWAAILLAVSFVSVMASFQLAASIRGADRRWW